MASKKKSKKKSEMCPCGHDIGWHTGTNRACVHGHGTATGGCSCLGYRTRRYRDETDITSPADILHPDPVRASLAAQYPVLDVRLERIERRLDRIDRIFSSIRHALDEKGGPSLIEAVPKFTAIEEVDEQYGWSEPDEARNVPSRRSRKTSIDTGAKKPDGSKLSKCEQAILDTLAQWKSRRALSTAFVSIYTGYSLRSGSFASALATLRKKNYIIGDAQSLSTTSLGDKFAQPKLIALDDEGLLQMWKQKLDKCSATILENLFDVAPAACSAKDIAHVTGYSASSGSFASALAKLRTLELIEGKNTALTLHRAFDI